MLVTDSEKINTYYQALLQRAPNYVGIFYVGVKTTAIFCIATCRARKPKKGNVEFYTTFKEALDAGYRPCKICKPTENSNEAPPQVEAAIKMVKENAKEKISDETLKKNKISPELVRRWFKRHYGITFQAYQRMYRINCAFQELKEGRQTTQAAFEAGYDSLSGFGYTYKKIVGKSPKHSIHNNVILISRLTTPLGPMFVCASNQGICLLEFVDRKMLETEFKDLQRLFNAPIVTGENRYIEQAKLEIGEYFSGKRQFFEVELDTPGTVFQKKVWDTLKTIPYGQTVSYHQQAEMIENQNAVRAVASANGINRVAIIIPCHRVIGKNGELKGYGGGLQRKRWLIEHEQSMINA